MLNIFLGHFWPEGASGGGGFSLFVTELLPTVQALNICICISICIYIHICICQQPCHTARCFSGWFELVAFRSMHKHL